MVGVGLVLLVLLFLYLVTHSSMLIGRGLKNKGYIRELSRQMYLLSDHRDEAALQLIDSGQMMTFDQRAVFVQLNHGQQMEPNTAFLRLEFTGWPEWLVLTITHERPRCDVLGEFLPITPSDQLVFPSMAIEEWLHEHWTHFEVVLRDNRAEVSLQLPGEHAKGDAKKLKAFLTQLPIELEAFCAQLPEHAATFFEMAYEQNPNKHAICAASLYQLYCLNKITPQAFSNVPADHIRYILSMIPPVDNLIEQLDMPVEKWLAVIEAARRARGDILSALLQACPRDAEAALVDFPAAAVPLSKHWWPEATEAQRMNLIELIRPVDIPEEDRAMWLTFIGHEAPQLCAYEDFEPLLKPGAHEAQAASALMLVLQHHPTLFTEHKWCEVVLGLVRGFDWEQAPWLAESLVAHAPTRVFGLIHTALQQDYFAISPLGVALTKQKSAWQGKLKKQDGQLSLAGQSMGDGSLSLTEQGGTITQIASPDKSQDIE